MSGIDTLKAYSFIRVGFNIRTPYGAPEDDPSGLELKVMSCLYSTGLFDYVDAAFTEGYLKDYVTITGRTLVDFAQAEDAAGYITETLKSCAPRVTLISRDPIVIDSIPEEQANVPGVQQPNHGQYNNQYRGNNDANKPKPDCWKTTTSWSDYLACELGVKPSDALLYGIGIALVGVIAINKLAR